MIVTVVLLEMKDVDVRDSTNEVEAGAELIAVTDVPLIVANGVADGAKKLVG